MTYLIVPFVLSLSVLYYNFCVPLHRPWKYAGLTEHSLMCGMVACKFMISVYKVDPKRLPAREEDRVTHI